MEGLERRSVRLGIDLGPVGRATRSEGQGRPPADAAHGQQRLGLRRRGHGNEHLDHGGQPPHAVAGPLAADAPDAPHHSRRDRRDGRRLPGPAAAAVGLHAAPGLEHRGAFDRDLSAAGGAGREARREAFVHGRRRTARTDDEDRRAAREAARRQRAHAKPQPAVLAPRTAVPLAGGSGAPGRLACRDRPQRGECARAGPDPRRGESARHRRLRAGGGAQPRHHRAPDRGRQPGAGDVHRVGPAARHRRCRVARLRRRAAARRRHRARRTRRPSQRLCGARCRRPAAPGTGLPPSGARHARHRAERQRQLQPLAGGAPARRLFIAARQSEGGARCAHADVATADRRQPGRRTHRRGRSHRHGVRQPQLPGRDHARCRAGCLHQRQGRCHGAARLRHPGRVGPAPPRRQPRCLAVCRVGPPARQRGGPVCATS
ncbi:hypothetical protein FQZ97_767220 [compost metagenome]